jgi:hypothetical protein
LVSLECCVEVHTDVEKADLKARQFTFDDFGSTTLELPTENPPFQLATDNIGTLDLSGASSVPLDIPSVDAVPQAPADGTVTDLAYVQPVSTETAYNSNIVGENSYMSIHEANAQLGPSLSVGTPVDHANDDAIQVDLRPFSQQYGGRTGLVIGNQNLKVGVYANPMIPQQPPMLGLEASF